MALGWEVWDTFSSQLYLEGGSHQLISKDKIVSGASPHSWMVFWGWPILCRGRGGACHQFPEANSKRGGRFSTSLGFPLTCPSRNRDNQEI